MDVFKATDLRYLLIGSGRDMSAEPVTDGLLRELDSCGTRDSWDTALVW